jgi:hypothetical protein
MDCKEANILLDKMVTGISQEDRGLIEDHAFSCPQCWSKYYFFKLAEDEIDYGTKLTYPLLASERLKEDIYERLKNERKTFLQVSWRARAVAVLVAIFSGVLMTQNFFTGYEETTDRVAVEFYLNDNQNSEETMEDFFMGNFE